MSSILPECGVVCRQEGPHSLCKAVLPDKEFSNHHPPKNPNQTMKKYAFNCLQEKKKKKIILAFMINIAFKLFREN